MLAVLFVLAACSPVCGAGSAPAETWKLTLTGPAAGSISAGASSCQAFTGKSFQYGLTSQMNGKDVVLTITIYSAFTGKGSYKVGTVLDGAGEVRLSVGDYKGATTSGAGDLEVNADGRSGTVDADLPEGEHISGSWKCDRYEAHSA